MNKEWKIVHDCDEESGEPTCWSLEINHSKYGKYIWITISDNGYDVEIDNGGFKTLATCKSLMNAKRWVTMNLL